MAYFNNNLIYQSMLKKSLRTCMAIAAMTLATGLQAASPVGPAPTPQGKDAPRWNLDAKAPRLAPGLRQVAGEPGTFEFSYSDGSAAYQYGANAAGAIEACMRLDDPALRGMKIVGLRVPNLNVTTSDVDWCKVWAATAPSRTHDLGEVNATMTGTGQTHQYYGNEIFQLEGRFDTPIVIGDAPIYVGYMLDIPDVTSSAMAGYPISVSMATTGMDHDGTGICYLCASVEDEFGEYSSAGALSAYVILQKDDQTPCEVSLRSILSVPTVEVGNSLRLVASVMNTGSQEAKTVEYTLDCNGTQTTGEAILPNPVTNTTAPRCEVAIDMPAMQNAGTYPCTLTLTKINGEENNAAEKSLNFDLTVTPAQDASALTQADKLSLYEGGQVVRMSMPDYRGYYELAVQVAHPSVKGMKVVGIKVTSLGYNGMGNYNGWATTTLGGEPISGRVYGTPDDSGTLTIVFPEPVEVPDEGLYVGFTEESLYPDNSFSSDGKTGAVPMVLNAKVMPGASWFNYLGGGQWMDYAAQVGYAAPITVFLAGETAPDNLMVDKINSYTVTMKDAPLNYEFEVANCGSNAVTDLTYTYTVDGVSTQKSVTLPEPMEHILAKTTTLSLDLGNAPSTQGKRDVTLTIDKVNGNANVCKSNTITFPLSVLEYAPNHRPMMEEVTATWCGWCPRGALGMEKLAEEFGDNFIGVSYHNGDDLTCTGYYPWESKGLPGSIFDRASGDIDPFYGSAYNGSTGTDMGIRDDYLAARNSLAVCDIDLSSTWADEEHNALNVEATVRFALDDPKADYKVGYLLLADGYCFPDDRNWKQVNYFSGLDYSGSMLDVFAQQPPVIFGYTWNDVVINANNMLGVPKSLPTNVKLGETYTHQVSFDTTNQVSEEGGYNMMERRDASKVVAFVVDGTGRVLNARMAAAGTAVGIHNIEADNAAGADANPVYYNLQGQRLNNPQSGIVIKVINGRATKVVL